MSLEKTKLCVYEHICNIQDQQNPKDGIGQH